jgi:hypothetical protein
VFEDRRCYSVFYFLTGTVRGPREGVTPIVEESRGWPDDPSPYSAEYMDMWNGDAHTASWASCSELLASSLANVDESYAAMVRFWATALDPDHVRFLYFFDN